MCGIAGIWTTRLETGQVRSKVADMTHCLSHRGSDDAGVNDVSLAASSGQAPLVVFGHRRLAIIDLSQGGHQPMQDPLTGNWITYNGEIYNFMDLRRELELRGHVFRSQSDTEVILKAYAEWGIGCWRRLRGIFAFGLWDQHYRELHLVRDHLGVKPLYFARTPAGLAFASEVRAILASNLVDRQLCMDGLHSYLKFGSVQEPCTMVEGIESVPAGHYLTCDQSGATQARHYWDVAECMKRNWEKQPSGADVLAVLEDSVRRQLISDVPVGVFLSGGADSSVVAALAVRAQPGAVRTFCIGLEDKNYDESEEAAQTAKFLGCRHTTLILEEQMVRARLEVALGSYDQPSCDGINTYFISLLVRQAGIKVALSGLGGDELFVGYHGFRKALAVERVGQLLKFIPAVARRSLSWAFAAVSDLGGSIGCALSDILEQNLVLPYFSSRLLFGRRHIAQLLDKSEEHGQQLSAWEKREQMLTAEACKFTGVDRVSYLELKTYMLSTLLRDSDQMSMAHGLELRVPLIDSELVEHVLPIPIREKMAKGVSKKLINDTLSGILPPGLMDRRKRGFILPFAEWLKRDLGVLVSATFLAEQPCGPWDRQAFRQIWKGFDRGRVSWSRIWMLFVLEKWLQQNGIRY